MKSPRTLPEPKIGIVKGGELSLSGDALITLMQAVLAKGVRFRFRAKGWSMTPFIRDGDVISVSPLRGAPARLGEVVAFVRPTTGNLVVHRVIGKRSTALLIQGDNAPDSADGLIPQANVLGRVTTVERGGRSVWLGLGPERLAIACLSRMGLLLPLRVRVPSAVRSFLRRWL